MVIEKVIINSYYGTHGYLLRDTDGSIVYHVKPKTAHRRIEGILSEYWVIGWEIYDHLNNPFITFDFEVGALQFLNDRMNQG